MRQPGERWRAMLAPVVLLLATGCGGNVVLKGALQKDGKPYVFADGEELEATLVGQDPSGRPFTSAAEVNKENGSLQFKGPTGQGIPPGTYKITLSSQQFSGPKQKGDQYDGGFSVERTPLSYTVTTDREQEIVIDVGQKKVTKK